ncbi:heat shock 70 kDa protein 17-like [Vitis riparia]|uniref:heat shock 70 kDa protein 17-like n=1 Tax=Vitis riparia TaxID=96939 RepID=UPI00155A3983|nr:heat shock 70 kDa protein 17-like [Vitis riparia]
MLKLLGSLAWVLSLTAQKSDSFWASPSGDFAFGFQQIGNGGFLLAIWFNKVPEKTIIWSANSDNPTPRGSKVELTTDGEFILNDQKGKQMWKADLIGPGSRMQPCLTLETLCWQAKIPPICGRVSIIQQTLYCPPRYWGKAANLLLCFTPLISQWIPQILLTDAQLAGVNVLALINEHLGVALQYGIDKDFSNGSRHEYGKTVSVNQFQVKDVIWDPELGGQNMEIRLVEYFADEFNKQVGNGVDVRKFPKAMAKLKKQVKRTKEILSANSVAPISVESLYDDRDFRSIITREKFEELCEDLWERFLIPVKEVLESSGLKVDELYAVELIGGATRVPKLQAKLQEFLGRKDLD